MTDTLLTIGVPTLAVLVGILINNSRLSDLRSHMDDRLTDLRTVMDARFEVVNVRFDTAKQELLRVEQVLDARLSNLEARLSHLENR